MANRTADFTLLRLLSVERARNKFLCLKAGCCCVHNFTDKSEMEVLPFNNVNYNKNDSGKSKNKN